MTCDCFLFDSSCSSALGVQDGSEPELEREFGDAGADADIIDEKMWNGEDDSDAASDEEKDEGKKDAGARQHLFPPPRAFLAPSAPCRGCQSPFSKPVGGCTYGNAFGL